MKNLRKTEMIDFGRLNRTYLAQLQTDIAVDGVTLKKGSYHGIRSMGTKDGPITVYLMNDNTPMAMLAELLFPSEVISVSRKYITDYPEFFQDGDETKPGPPKQFPYRKELRYSEEEKDCLEALTINGEDASELIRRLIREEHERRR